MIFTVEEENLLCIYDTASKKVLMEDIRAAMPEFEEGEHEAPAAMREIAKRTLRKLDAMSDKDFTEYIFSPAYYNEDDETEG